MLTIFMLLIEAINSCQAGTTHLRNIMAPMFQADDEARVAEVNQFYAEAEGDPEGFSRIEFAVSNAGLSLPEQPGPLSFQIPSTEGQPATTIEVPPAQTPEQLQATLAAMASGDNPTGAETDPSAAVVS